MGKSLDFLYPIIPYTTAQTVLTYKTHSCSEIGSNSSNSYSLILEFLELSNVLQSHLSYTPFQKELIQ